ncbi:hypothetical protein GRX03_13610 [Halovenus sp. WSH3]|uniref:Uncharacterized protein n=1 Tax=Halovenus carboxidivorans TaxID=2692199 RepID=A0A6B0T2Y7_9EURY|nr:hypothetical protein [Halovenus carboxidivorans]MXR52638.1 hypothetical protein [Halovenus carboxidivorans]
MTTRRGFLVGAAGVGSGIALSGCAGFFGSDTEDQSPGTGLLGGIADPTEQVRPEFFSGYHYRIPGLTGAVNLAAVTPGIGGGLIGVLNEEIPDLTLEDMDTFTGSRVRSQGIAGGGLALSVPSGQSLVVEGEFGTEPFTQWLSQQGVESLGTQDGYERYAVTKEETSGFEAFAVTDGTFIAVARSNVDSGPETALTTEIDHQSSGGTSLADNAPSYASVVEELDEAPMRRAAGYALVPLGADTGTEAFDTAVSGIVGSGLSVSPGMETAVQRAVSYLDPSMADGSALLDAYAASEQDELGDSEWSTSTNGAVVSARTSVTGAVGPAMLQTALPIAGYENLWNPIDPTALGRATPPIVYFQPSVTDSGTLMLEQIAGSDVEDLLVRYVHDGTEQREPWEGPVGKGDTFESQRSIDSGTQAWVVWRPDTTDAAVVARFWTPS